LKKRILAISLFVILLSMVCVGAAFAIGTPTTYSVIHVEAYEDYLEQGDQLYLIHFDISYAGANPVGYDVTDLFLVRLLNSGTELRSVAPYTFNSDGTSYLGDGFDMGVASIYFATSEINALSVTWNSPTYYIEIAGNPIYGWDSGTPPAITRSIDSWFNDNQTETRLTTRIRVLAQIIENRWDDDLIIGPAGQQTFSLAGEEYFTNTIPNIRIICPSLFSATITDVDFPDSNNISDYYTAYGNSGTSVLVNQMQTQSFTATWDYELDRAEFKMLRVGTPPDVRVTVHAFSGTPSATVLTSGTITLSQLDTFNEGKWVEVNFPDNIDLTRTNQYCFIMHGGTATGTNTAVWRGQNPGTFAEGVSQSGTWSAWNTNAWDNLFLTKTNSDFGGASGHKYEDRLIGTNFDMTQAAEEIFGMSRLEFSTVLWIILALAFGIFVSLKANTFKVIPYIMLVLVVIGWIAGFVSTGTMAIMMLVCAMGIVVTIGGYSRA